ncbi:MAG: M4 family metallopeptidase, partial [Synergistaceae bacterium]|nr:M4 family metallopeptidase [Synergistaceae bacterium]
MKSLSDGADSSFGLAGIKTVDELYEHYRTVPAQYYGNDGNGCHTYCRLVTHAAYLMHQDGASKIGRSTSQALTWHELGRVWYKSLNLGLDSTSNFHTVRRNVIRAARQMRLAETKIITIRKAFDSLGITEAQGTLKGGIEDWDDGTVVPGS